MISVVPVPVDYRQDRIQSALLGTNPTVMRRMPASFAVFGDLQWLPGYSVLLVDRPGVSRLSDLDRAARRDFLSSMDLLGEAVELACRRVLTGFRRVNLEILGNTDEFLHAHVWPRYDWEPAERVTKPVWLYPAELWQPPTLQSDTQHVNTQHDSIRAAITEELSVLDA